MTGESGTEADIVAIIPARGGSKGVPRKNVREVAGKPLIAYSIDHGRSADRVDLTLVSTDDAEIAETAREFGAEVIDRPADLATDTAPVLPVLKHAVRTLRERGTDPDVVILLQPTTPLRSVADVHASLDRLAEGDVDSVTTVSHSGIHPNCLVTLEYDETVAHVLPESDARRRQDAEDLYVIDGVVYAYETSALMELEGASWCEDNGVVVTEPERAIDIDEEYELRLAECLLEDR